MTVVCAVLTLALILLVVHIVFSWIPRPPEPIMPFVRLVRRIVDPVLMPLRRLLPPVSVGPRVAFDLSTLVVFVLISLLQANFGCGSFF